MTAHIRFPISPIPETAQLLRDQGKLIRSNRFTSIRLLWSGDPQTAFTCAVSAKEGVFISQTSFRGTISEALHPSDIAWWMWVKAVNRQYPQWEDTAAQVQGVSYAGLSSFWVQEITNRATQELIRRALPDNFGPGVYSWEPDSDVSNPDLHGNAFWALLGSPNGSKIIFFVKERKITLEGKGIVRLKNGVVPWGQSYTYTMWADIGNGGDGNGGEDNGGETDTGDGLSDC